MKVNVEFWGLNKRVAGWFHWKVIVYTQETHPTKEDILDLLKEDYREVDELIISSIEEV